MSGDPLLCLQRLDARALDCTILPLPIDSDTYSVQQITQSPSGICTGAIAEMTTRLTATTIWFIAFMASSVGCAAPNKFGLLALFLMTLARLL